MYWIKYIYQFILLVLIQVLLLNHIHLSGFITPYIYVLFILLLPFNTNKLLLLLLAFVMGITIDVFSSTPGLHASALVLMAFCRPYILKILTPRDGYDMELQPIARDMGWKWFVTYAGILVFIHHLFFFYVEVFRFSQFFITLGRCVASFIFSFLLILLSQLFFSQRNATFK